MPSVKGMEFALNLADGLARPSRGRPRAMRMLVMGDFSGRSNNQPPQPEGPIDERPVVRVDVDSLEDALRRLAPRLKVPLPGTAAPVDLAFRYLSDFCPESLCERLPTFRPFREIRGRLLDSSTFSAAAAELEGLLGRPPVDTPAEGETGPVVQEAPAESDAQTIERLLGRSAAGVSQVRSHQSEKAQAAVSELIRRAVSPHVVSGQPPRADLYLRAVDGALAERMRALLHTPAFQALEAGWLSLHHLVTNLETDEGLQIHILDVSKQALAADLASAGSDLKASGLYRLLVEQTGAGTPGGEPWSLLVSSFAFGPGPEDLGLLAALGVIAASAGGPFLAAGSPELLGCRSLAETPNHDHWAALPADAEAAWNALRRTPIAPWVGLALPRVLLRLPYGKDTEPVAAFDFEELGPERRHGHYLWGNPAFVCARLIGQAYAARGWAMTPGDVLDLGDLPMHVYEEGREKRLQAGAEVFVNERTATAMLDRGIMPLLSFKGRNLVRLARFQSIASPPTALKGSWTG